MTFLDGNLPETLLILGLALLALEVIVLGFSTFVLFFVGLACVFTGLLMFINLLPESILTALIAIASITSSSAFLLWKPLQKMQNRVEHTPVQNDLIGYRFMLDSDISSKQSGQHKYSGITWQINSAEPLCAGTTVKVVATDVGIFTVAALAPD